MKTVSVRLTSLEAAMNESDHRLMRFLTSRGTSVENLRDFSTQRAGILLSAFEKLSPIEGKQFGGAFLSIVVNKDDLRAINAPLEAEADINRVVRQRGKRLSSLGFAMTYNQGFGHELMTTGPRLRSEKQRH